MPRAPDPLVSTVHPRGLTSTYLLWAKRTRALLGARTTLNLPLGTWQAGRPGSQPRAELDLPASRLGTTTPGARTTCETALLYARDR